MTSERAQEIREFILETKMQVSERKPFPGQAALVRYGTILEIIVDELAPEPARAKNGE